MAQLAPITLHEGNDEVLVLTIDRVDPSDDLSTVTSLELYLKVDSCARDADVTTVLLTSAQVSQIDVVTQTAAQITATAYIPAGALVGAYDRWWRVDALSPGTRRTALYGPVTVIDL